jgi:hypothetical protein
LLKISILDSGGNQSMDLKPVASQYIEWYIPALSICT